MLMTNIIYQTHQQGHISMLIFINDSVAAERTCVSLDQPVCDVPAGGFTGSDDLYHLVKFRKNSRKLV